MTGPQSPTWPSSRVLAAWWPQLDRLHPRGLWLYHLLLHRVEAAVVVARPPPQERLDRLLLEALAARPGPASAALLAADLHLDAQVLRRLLAGLESAGLARSSAAGWEPTAAGREAAAGRRGAATLHERRAFYFAEGPASHPGARFLPLDRPPTSPFSEGGDWSFDPAMLAACAARPAEWKERHGFPAEVAGVAGPAPRGGAWQQVPVDRAEQLVGLFALCGDGAAESLVGLPVQPGGWQLQAERPLLALGASWRELLPELADEPGVPAWREAWRTWGELRGLPPADLEACALERKGVRLRVRAPQPLAEQLRSSRAEFARGETWLLAGEGRVRCAAVVELADG